MCSYYYISLYHTKEKVQLWLVRNMFTVTRNRVASYHESFHSYIREVNDSLEVVCLVHEEVCLDLLEGVCNHHLMHQITHLSPPAMFHLAVVQLHFQR